MDPEPAAELPGLEVGRYVLREELGAGAMGVVYAAHDPELGRQVALKLVRLDRLGSADEGQLADRLVREARAMARLAHPNVVTIHDVGRAGDQVFIAMELVAGQTLTGWLAERPRSWREIAAVFVDAGRGLAAAHEAGLLHRDFKPDNVLIGRDGRPRVGDFGLARPLSAASTGADNRLPAGADLEATLPASATGDGGHPGFVSGTPFYMAPEQWSGLSTDARTDQFSFCVALWHALYRQWPYGGETTEGLAAAVLVGELRPPPRSSRVPIAVRRALARGLSREPDGRFPSMSQLLHVLAALVRRRRRRVVAAVAASLVAVAGVAVLARLPGADAPALCSGADRRFAPVWDSTHQEAIRRAFAATGVLYADGAATRVVQAIDRYRGEWVAMQTESCRATRVTGEQPEDVLRVRAICLDTRLKDVRALVELLSRADKAVVEGAVAAALRLPPLSACADVATLTAVVPPPSDPRVRGEVDRVGTQLAAARAQQAAGRYPAALETAWAAATEAAELGYRPLEAEALFTQGQLERLAGEPRAEKTLMAAIRAAEAGKHDRVAAAAWTELTFLVGYQQAQYARGADLAASAGAALERMGGDPAIEGNLEKARGAMAADQGKGDEAVTHFERAVALLGRAVGAENPSVATALDNLGMAELALGRTDSALARHRRSLDVRRRALGPEHPTVAQSLHNLGNAELAADDAAAAETHLRQALAQQEKLLGPDHPDVATAATDLARALTQLGRFDEALALHHRALTAGEKAFGPEHPTFAQQLINAGLLLHRMKRFDEAFALHRRAAGIRAKVMGPDRPETARARISMAEARLAGGHAREALALYREALAVLEKAPEQDRAAIGACLLGAGLALLDLRQPGAALPLIERATTLAGDDAGPLDRSLLLFATARALWDARRDRARAVTLAEEARKQAAAAGAPAADEARRIDAWLAARRRGRRAAPAR